MKKALIVVDYQNDFVTGSLGFSAAEALEERICRKLEEYRSRSDSIIFTFDTHTPDYLQTQEGKNLPVEHCIRGTSGWELYGKVSQYAKEAVCFEKETFGSLKLAEYLKEEDFTQVELVGVVSNICVISNSVLAKAALPEAQIIVDAQCTASNDNALHEKALDLLENLQITVLNRHK